MPDAVVIGAGVGGLSAAISLAARGREVLVLEAANRPGGKAGVVEIDGVEVDTGPSLLTLPSVFDAIFEEAGTTLRDELTLLRPDPAFRYIYPDGVTLDIHHEVEDTLQSVRETLGPGPAAELATFLRYAERIWEAAAPEFVFGSAPRFSTLVLGGPAKWLAASRIDPFRSMKSAIDERVRSQHLRHLLYRYATYNGSDVRRAPATLNCIAHVELSLGGFAVEGGIQELIAALARVATRLGVRLRYGARVESVALTNGRVSSVRVHGEQEIETGSVVANTEAVHLVESLLPEATHTGIRFAETPSMSAHNAILKAKKSPAQRVGHTVVFPERYLDEFADIFDRRQVPQEPTVYLCAQHICHRRKAWADEEPLFLMVNAPGGVEPARVADDDTDLAPLWKNVHARLVRRGLTEESDEFVWSRTPGGLATRFPGSRGSLYGAASNDRWAAFRRPPNVVAKVPGLYLASGTAHPGGGLPLAACSGRQAAAALCARAPDLGASS